MSKIAEFFQREDAIKEMTELLPDPVKRQQVIHIQELIADGKLDEAEQLTDALDEETKQICINVAASLLLALRLSIFCKVDILRS